MVKWPNFRNFIGDNQTVMNKNKPLDQVCSIGANALNLTSKLVNKSEFNGSILERLMDFAGSVPDFRRSDKGNIRHRYGVEDRLEGLTPVYTYTEGPELGHGRIETRTYRIYDGLEVIQQARIPPKKGCM